MSQLVEFELEEGGHVLVEAQGGGGLVTRGGGGQVQERASESFNKSIAKVKPAADALVASMAELRQRPDEITVEFGVNFSAEAGAFIGSVAAEASFRVQLKWAQSSGSA